MGDDERRNARIFWLLCLATLGNYMAQGVLFPGLPLYLTRELGTSKATAGLVVSSMSIASIVSRPWAGAFIDRRGRKPLLVVGPALTIVTGIGLLTLHSVAAVLVLRILQGFGSSMSYSAAAAMAADLAPAAKRARYLARFGMFFYIGFALGPWLAEFLIGRSGFSAVWITVIVASALGGAVALFLPETWRPAAGGAAPPRMSVLRRLFHPAAMSPGIVFFCVGVGWAALSSFLALYARDAIGLATSQSLFLTLSITVLATRAFAGSLADRLGKNAVLYPCLAAIVVGETMLAVVKSPLPAYVALVIFGAGFSGLFPVLFTMVVDAAPAAERGTAMSSFNVFYDIGAPIGGFGVGALVDWGGFGLGLGSTAVLAAFGALLLVWGDRARRGWTSAKPAPSGVRDGRASALRPVPPTPKP